MRHHLDRAMKAIRVCCILENICRDWSEELPPNDEHVPDAPDAGNQGGAGGGGGGAGEAAHLQRGKAMRISLMNEMPYLG